MRPKENLSLNQSYKNYKSKYTKKNGAKSKNDDAQTQSDKEAVNDDILALHEDERKINEEILSQTDYEKHVSETSFSESDLNFVNEEVFTLTDDEKKFINDDVFSGTESEKNDYEDRFMTAEEVDKNNSSLQCSFCSRGHTTDVLESGKLYQLKDMAIHYFCLLFANNGLQQGTDEEGLFGFLIPDVRSQIAKGARNKCRYCTKKGAASKCVVRRIV